MSATAWAVGLCAAALLCRPDRSRPVIARLDGGQRPDRTRGWAVPLDRAGRLRCMLAAGTALALALLGVVGVLPALSAGVAAAVVVHLLWAARGTRVDRAAGTASVEWVGALAAELRAGRGAELALAAATEHAAPILRSRLLGIKRTAGYGGDVPRAIREIARAPAPGDSIDGQEPVAAVLRRVAAGWSLSQSTGCSLADVLAAVEADLRDQQRHRREIDGLLAGPRATAALLAVLPVLGLAMGSALGADPWQVLTSTGAGQLALAAGVALDVAGVLWTARLVRGADRR